MGRGALSVDSNGNDVPASTSNVLRRLDWLIEEDEFVQWWRPIMVHLVDKPLLTTAFNVMTVGRTIGSASNYGDAIDSIYVADRSAIHLVVPESVTSNAPLLMQLPRVY